MIAEIYLELLVPTQSTEILNLLEFPGKSLIPDQSQLKIKVMSEGRRKQIKINEINEFISRTAATKFNEIEVTYTFEPYTVDNFLVKSIRQALGVSPNNVLWSDTNSWPESKNINIHRELYSLGSHESFIKYHGLSSYPCILATHIEIEGEINQEVCNSWFAKKIEQSIPEEFIGRIFGYGGLSWFDAVENDWRYIRASTETRIINKPGIVSQLHERFASIQPIMVHNLLLCQEFIKAVPEVHGFYKVETVNKDNGTGILVLNSETYKSAETTKKAVQLLVD